MSDLESQGSLSAFEQVTELHVKIGNNQRVGPLVKNGAGKAVKAWRRLLNGVTV